MVKPKRFPSMISAPKQSLASITQSGSRATERPNRSIRPGANNSRAPLSRSCTSFSALTRHARRHTARRPMASERGSTALSSHCCVSRCSGAHTTGSLFCPRCFRRIDTRFHSLPASRRIGSFLGARSVFWSTSTRGCRNFHETSARLRTASSRTSNGPIAPRTRPPAYSTAAQKHSTTSVSSSICIHLAHSCPSYCTTGISAHPPDLSRSTRAFAK